MVLRVGREKMRHRLAIEVFSYHLRDDTATNSKLAVVIFTPK